MGQDHENQDRNGGDFGHGGTSDGEPSHGGGKSGGQPISNTNNDAPKSSHPTK